MIRTLSRIARAGIVAGALSGCYLFRHSYIAPPPPMAPVDPAPPPALSVVQLPVAVSMADLRTVLESAVPPGVDVARYNAQANGGADHCSDGLSYGYYVRRGPLSLEAAADGRIAIGTQVDYGVAGQSRQRIFGLCGLLVTGQCGYDGDGPRQARLRIYAKPELDQSWALQLHSGGAQADALNRCRVTVLGKDITDRVLDGARGFLDGQAGALNAKAAADTRLHDAVVRAWLAAWTPIPLGQNGWLVIAPEAVGVQSPVVTADSVRVVLRVAAHPSVSLGAPPQPVPTVLPTNGGVPDDDSIRIDLPVRADYGAIRARLRQALHLDDGGTRYPATGRFFIKPSDVDVSGAGHQLVVRVAFNGSARGVLYLTGTPAFDAATQTVTAPDLDYTVETKSVLLKMADWIAGEQLRNDLRAKVRVDLTQPLQATTKTLTAAMNQTVGTLALHGSVARLALRRIIVDSEHHRVEALATFVGSLSGSVVPPALTDRAQVRGAPR